MARQPEAALLEFLQTQLGDSEVVRFCGWDHASSDVWEVRTGEGLAYLKVHKQPRKFRQEVYAYRNWTPHLPETPCLIAVHGPPDALLLSAVPGTPVGMLELNPARERDVYRQAGAALRRLHDIPFEDTDAVPLADALVQRSDAWTARGTVIEAQIVAWVCARLRSAADLVRREGWGRVPCHRDYTARNWLLSGRTVSVIDFEHAKPDLWLSDFETLRSDVGSRRPDLEGAFFSGYGRVLSDLEAGVLTGLAAHGALVTTIWAAEHGDAALEKRGRDALAAFQHGDM